MFFNMLWWILAVIFAIYFYKYFIKPNQYWQELNVVHLKPWLFIGNMGAYFFRQKTIAEWVQEIYNAYDSRYIGLYFFSKPFLMIKDLNLLKQMCIKDFDHFPEHQTMLSEDIDPLFGKSLFGLTGQRWRHMRSTLSPAFTGSKMRAMFVLISECGEQFVDYFSKQVDPKEPLTLEMKDAFTRFANDVIANTAFGIKSDSLNEKDNEFYMMGKDLTSFDGIRGLKFFGYCVSPMLMKLFKIQLFNEDIYNFFRNLIVNTVNTREKQGIVRPDMIHLLMQARNGTLRHEEVKNSEHEAGFATVEESHIGKDSKQALMDLSDDDITAQALIFFYAGFESISIALCHMAYELALNEDIQTKLQLEIDSTLNECNGKLTYDALMNMKYMDMVVSETLRKWPVTVAVDRLCVDPYIIPAENPDEQPIKLEKNIVLSIPIYAYHRDPKYFPNPEIFDPERFNDENKEKIIPQSYMPFGIGPRNCIGSRFALLEAKLVFFHLLAKFSLVIVEKSEIPLKISKTQFNLNAKNGFWLGVQLRN